MGLTRKEFGPLVGEDALWVKKMENLERGATDEKRKEVSRILGVSECDLIEPPAAQKIA